jgi:hypothetical protein
MIFVATLIPPFALLGLIQQSPAIQQLGALAVAYTGGCIASYVALRRIGRSNDERNGQNSDR